MKYILLDYETQIYQSYRIGHDVNNKSCKIDPTRNELIRVFPIRNDNRIDVDSTSKASNRR